MGSPPVSLGAYPRGHEIKERPRQFPDFMDIAMTASQVFVVCGCSLSSPHGLIRHVCIGIEVAIEAHDDQRFLTLPVGVGDGVSAEQRPDDFVPPVVLVRGHAVAEAAIEGEYSRAWVNETWRHMGMTK